MFTNYNVNDLTALLHARGATAVAPAPNADASSASQGRQPIPNFLLAASTRTSNASTQVSNNTSLVAANRAPDPPGCHGEEPPLQLTMAAAVSALSGKRAAGPMYGAAGHLQHVEEITKRARRMRSWDEMFGALVNFHARYGSTAVPLSFPEDPELGLWVESQRRRKFLLSAEEKYKLELIGFQWNYAPSFAVGNAGFSNHARTNPALDNIFASFRREVPAAATGPSAAQNQLFLGSSRKVLGAMDYFGSHVNAATAPINETVSPIIASETQQWKFMFDQLQAFHAVHKNFDVHLHSQDISLGVWTMQQKELYRRGTLPMEHKAKLEAIGFFDVNTDTPTAASASAPAPAAAAKTGSVKQEKERKAQESIASPPQEESQKKRVRTFDENFDALLEYKKIHGNVDVPQKYEKDRKLGIWVKNVRQHPQRHTQEQRDRLDSIGFKWRKLQLDEQWADAFTQLLEYKETYGDCNVPSRWKKCPALARWVHTQRTMYRRNKLLDDRKEKLEDAGFVWDCNAMRDDEAFHENYEKLLEFKKSRGHCNVPNKYRRDRPLGRWAAKMRDLYFYDQLDADRRKALSDIGFVWEQDEEESPAQDGAPRFKGTSAAKGKECEKKRDSGIAGELSDDDTDSGEE